MISEFFSFPTFPLFVALSVMVIAGIWEVSTFRVPNALTFGACGAALLFAAWKSAYASDTPGGLGPMLLGTLLGGLLLMPFRQKLGLGAGCVKSGAAFGAWLGCGLSFGMTAAMLVLSTAVGLLILGAFIVFRRPNVTLVHAQFPMSIGVTCATGLMLVYL